MAEMETYWLAKVRPKSHRRNGAAFELAMVVQTGCNWEYHEQQRYSDKPLLSEDCLI